MWRVEYHLPAYLQPWRTPAESRFALYYVTRCIEPNRNAQKCTYWHARPTKTQVSLRLRAGWSESSLSACRNFASLAIQNAPSEDSDQTARMRRLIWIFVGCTFRKYTFWRCGSIDWVSFEFNRLHETGEQYVEPCFLFCWIANKRKQKAYEFFTKYKINSSIPTGQYLHLCKQCRFWWDG